MRKRVIFIGDIPNIQRNVTRLLNSIPIEDFLQSFQDLYSRSHLCIVMGGDCFEGQVCKGKVFTPPLSVDLVELKKRNKVIDELDSKTLTAFGWKWITYSKCIETVYFFTNHPVYGENYSSKLDFYMKYGGKSERKELVSIPVTRLPRETTGVATVEGGKKGRKYIRDEELRRKILFMLAFRRELAKDGWGFVCVLKSHFEGELVISAMDPKILNHGQVAKMTLKLTPNFTSTRGQSEARPPVLKSLRKLGTHLSIRCSRDERLSRPFPARE
ncbi:hypothetical protein TNCV_1777201 [Trichonephila clavipes]|nr:hypothetical protein TNCV_1777201 [Trichonephila clavipes]